MSSKPVLSVHKFNSRFHTFDQKFAGHSAPPLFRKVRGTPVPYDYLTYYAASQRKDVPKFHACNQVTPTHARTLVFVEPETGNSDVKLDGETLQ
jgi:hypothetical protein